MEEVKKKIAEAIEKNTVVLVSDTLAIEDRSALVEAILKSIKPFLKVKRKLGGDAVSLHSKCKDFYTEYCTDNEFECYWTRTHASALNQLLAKIRYSYKMLNKTDPTDEKTLELFKRLIVNLPEYYKSKEQFHIQTINSKYDRIINSIRGSASRTGVNSGSSATIANSEKHDEGFGEL